jgi:hypothetical protein
VHNGQDRFAGGARRNFPSHIAILRQEAAEYGGKPPRGLDNVYTFAAQQLDAGAAIHAGG